MTALLASTLFDAEHALAVLTPAGWIDRVAACTEDVSLWDDDDVLRHCAQAVPGASPALADRAVA